MPSPKTNQPVVSTVLDLEPVLKQFFAVKAPPLSEKITEGLC
jgi:hypothetical protein